MILRYLRPYILLQLLMITTSIVLLIQPGGFGNVDALVRYQATRSFWTAEPQCTASQIETGFILVGKGGRPCNWFGVGHAAWMLPFDIAGSAGGRLAQASLNVSPESGDALRRLFVACGSNVASAVLTLASAYCLVIGLGYDRRIAGLTGLVLLLGTSFLHYAQVAQENNLMLALTILALALIHHAIVRSRPGWMVMAGLVLGAGLTIRLPFVFHIACVLGVAMLWRLETHGRTGEGVRIVIRDGIQMSPGLLLGLVVDRIYHFARFGSWTGTYMAVFREQSLAKNPNLPKDFPFNIELLNGIKASVLSGDKFLFFYDPLGLPALILPILLWKLLPRPLRPMFWASILLIVISTLFHARYAFGDTGGSWGPRYVVSSIQLLVVVASPLVITSWKTLNPIGRWITGALLACSVAVQVSSVCFTCYLEVVQRNSPDSIKPLILMRLQNAVSLLKSDGLSERVRGRASVRDATPNFAPFVVSQKGQEPSKQTRFTQIWMAGVAVAGIQVLLFAACLCWKEPTAVALRPPGSP